MEAMMMGEKEMPSKNDFVFDTIVVGMSSWAAALIPVLLWFLFEKNRPGMSMFDGSNDWYFISWWAWWIGNLVAYAGPAIMWIPAYFNDTAGWLYGMSWIWGMGVGGLTFIFVWTSLLVSGIEWKDWKEIWVVFVLFTVGNMVLAQMGQKSSMGAKIWYMWNTMEKMCTERDENGECIWPEGKDPLSMLKDSEDKEGDDWDM